QLVSGDVNRSVARVHEDRKRLSRASPPDERGRQSKTCFRGVFPVVTTSERGAHLTERPIAGRMTSVTLEGDRRLKSLSEHCEFSRRRPLHELASSLW